MTTTTTTAAITPTPDQVVDLSKRFDHASGRIDAALAVVDCLEDEVQSDARLYALCTAIRACLEDTAADVAAADSVLGVMATRIVARGVK